MISTSQPTPSSIGYTTSPTKKYWCHKCKKEFSKLYIENVDIQIGRASCRERV